MAKKSLLIITPKTYSGGAENVAARLSRHFDASYKLSVISFDSSRMDYNYAGSMIDLSLPYKAGLLHRLYVLCRACKKVRKIKKDVNPVACVSLIGHPNMVNVISRRGERCVVSVRTCLRRSPSKIKHFLQKKITKLIYNRADKVVAICEGVKKDLVEYYGVDPSKVEVIYPYFDVNEIGERSLEAIEPEWQHVFSKPVIITVGRLTYDKGQWHLIKAFMELKKIIPDAVLVILGCGELEDNLKTLADKTGYADDIHFMGYQENPFKYIRAAKVFALPSLIEGFGNALGEALACGTPAVAADCDVGPREVLAPDGDPHVKATSVEQYPAGFLVPPFDASCDLENLTPTATDSSMADALIRVIKDSDLRDGMSSAAAQRALAFDISKLAKSWDSLIVSV